MYRQAKNSAIDFNEQYTEAKVKALGCYYKPYATCIGEGDISGTQIYQDVQPIQPKATWNFNSATQEGWVGGIGWTFSTPPSQWDGLLTDTSITQASVIEPSGIYKVTFTISSYTTGTLTPQVGTVGGTAVSSAGTFSQTITSPDNSVGDLSLNGSLFTGSITEICLEFLGYDSQWGTSAEGWTTGSFVLSGGTMGHASGAGVNPLERDLLESGCLYGVAITFGAFSGGNLVLENGGNTISTFTNLTSQTVIRYFTATDVDLTLTPDDLAIIDVESVQVTKYYTGSKMGICTKDCEFVEFLADTEVSQVSNALAVQVDWDSHTLNEKCYKLCYFDAEENCLTKSALLNPELDGDAYWLGETGLTIGVSNSILAEVPAAPGARAANIAHLCPGVKYSVAFGIPIILGTADVRVNLGSAQSAVFNTTGSKSFELVATGGGEFSFEFNIVGASAIAVDNVVVTAIIDETTTPTACSNVFEFCTECERTTYVTWNNNYGTTQKNAFDFDYINYPNYINSARFLGKLQEQKWTATNEIDINDARDYNISSSVVATKYVLAGEMMPNWLIKSVTMGVNHNNFLINGIKYVSEGGDFTPETLNCLMGNMSLELTESGNKNVNQGC